MNHEWKLFLSPVNLLSYFMSPFTVFDSKLEHVSYFKYISDTLQFAFIYLLFFVFYAFTAPFVNPLTMYLCIKIKINTTGEIAMIPNAIVEFHSV